jgi:hypothetical protein
VRAHKLTLAPILLLLGAAVASGADASFQCTATAGVPPQLRAEGLTELVADVLLTCFGGQPLALGAQIPTIDITIMLNTGVTSRLLNTGGVTGASEALLMVDEPQSATYTGAPYGSTLPQIYCGHPSEGAGAGGCTEYTGNTNTSSGVPGGVPVASNPNTGPGGTFNSAPLTAGANVFQGIAGGSSVVFHGIPVEPPAGGTDTFRVFRITNVRVDAFQIAGPSVTPVSALINSTAGFPITNALSPVGYVSSSLQTAIASPYSSGNSGLASATTLRQCQFYPPSGNTPVALETLVFTEKTGSAFKVRGSTSQNLPGQVFTNMESALTVGAVTGTTPGGTAIAGYADWGTRLKAVFTNIPQGISLYVSTVNLNSSYNAPMGSVAHAGSLTGSPFAQLITGETAPDSGPSTTLADNFTAWAPVVSAVGTATGSVTGTTAAGAIPYAPLTIVNGTATAVWEVVNSIQNNPDTLAFEVFGVQASDPSHHLPTAPASMQVRMGYAPDQTQGAFQLADGMSASNALGILRFANLTDPQTAAVTVVCDSTPALSPWALAVLAALMLIMGALLMRRRWMVS